jgi:hypothetical protein
MSDKTCSRCKAPKEHATANGCIEYLTARLNNVVQALEASTQLWATLLDDMGSADPSYGSLSAWQQMNYTDFPTMRRAVGRAEGGK